MAIKKGICKNYGECDLADSKPPVIQEAESSNFVCEECGKELHEVSKTSHTPSPVGKIIAIVAGVALLGGGGYYFFSKKAADTPKIEQIVLNHTTRQFTEGLRDTLRAVIIPKEAGGQLNWTSSDPAIVAVTDGIVSAIAPGTAKVVVQTVGNEEVKAICQYTVLPKETEVVTPQTTGQPEEKEKDDLATSPAGSIDLGYATWQGDAKNGKPHGNGTMLFKSRHLIPGTKDSYAEANEQVIGAFRDGEINMGTLYQKNGNRVVVKHK